MLELFTVISITFIVAVVPGADFVIVTRNAINGGRLAGIMTALGIALALGVHVSYALAGIGLIISQSIYLFNALKLVGALYLIILGIMMYRAASPDMEAVEGQKTITPLKALRWGFLTNVTNPKATMFALSVFVQVTSHDTPLMTQIGYGFVMAGGVFLWFALVTMFFTYAPIRAAFLRMKMAMERTFGVLLAALGMGIALTTGSTR